MSLSRLAARRGGFQRGVGMAPEQVGALPQPGGLLVAAGGAPPGTSPRPACGACQSRRPPALPLGFGAQTGAAYLPLRPLPRPSGYQIASRNLQIVATNVAITTRR
jgi:hypothetical protein